MEKRDRIHFRDQFGNYYEVNDFDFVLPHATEQEGEYHYPRPYIYDDTGKMIRHTSAGLSAGGEVGLVMFREGNCQMPVWLGAIRPANWPESRFYHGYRKDTHERRAERHVTSKCLEEKISDPDGDTSEQRMIYADVGDSLLQEDRKKKLRKVVTKTSSTTMPGTRLVREAGFDESPDQSGGIAAKVPDGDYHSIRHYAQKNTDTDDRVLRGHFSVQLTNKGELLIDLNQLLEGITEKAQRLVGEGNVKVRILGSNPQGDRENVLAGKNGNIDITYNGDLSLANDAQTVTKDGAVRHNLRQEFRTENAEGKEKISILQSTVDRDTAERKAVVNSIIMDATGVRQDTNPATSARRSSIEILNQSEDKNDTNKILLDNKSGQEAVEIRSEHGNAVNVIAMKDKREKVSSGAATGNMSGIEISSTDANNSSVSNKIDMDLATSKEKIDITNQTDQNKRNSISLDGADNEQMVSLINKVGDTDNTLILNGASGKEGISLTNKKGQALNSLKADSEGWTISDSKGNIVSTIVDGDGSVRIAHNDKATVITVEKGKITVSGKDVQLVGDLSVSGDLDVSGKGAFSTGGDKAAKTQPLVDILTAIFTTLETHIHPGPTGPTSTSPQTLLPNFVAAKNKAKSELIGSRKVAID